MPESAPVTIATPVVVFVSLGHDRALPARRDLNRADDPDSAAGFVGGGG